LDPGLTEAFTAMCRQAASTKAAWYQRMLDTLVRSTPSVPAGPKDILSVADSRELRIIYRIAQETNAVLDLDTLLSRIVNISRGRVVGVLNAESQHADAFSEADVALMSAVGSQLASYLEVAQLHDTLKREASHDPLTRLNNRRLFLERIQQEVVRAGGANESF